MQTNYRNAKIRKAILELLQELRRPLTASDILVSTRKRFKKTNKTTIYRGLEILNSEGLVKTISFGDRHQRYEVAALPHHHHLVCTSCSRIEDVFVKNDLIKIEKKIEKEKAFANINHSLEFFGVCQGCT